MRRSATERIIREEAEAKALAARGPRALESAALPWSEAPGDDYEELAVRGPPFMLMRPEEHGLNHDDDTKVSYVRSAEALEKLRSFDLPTPHPTGRGPAEPSRRRPAGLPQGRPRPAPDTEPAEVAPPETPPPPAAAGVPAAPAEVGFHPRTGIGRRLGLVVAAATAAIVVLGAWTAHSGRLAHLSVSVASPGTSPGPVAPPASGPLIAPIIEPAPAAVAPEPPPPLPALPVGTPSSEGSVGASHESTTREAPPTVVDPKPRATNQSARPAHKAGGKATRHKPHGAKAGKRARAGHGRGPRIAAPKPTKFKDHPDDPLPVSFD